MSIFNTFTKRNRRYNFNRNSIFSRFFNEYSYYIGFFRKASKCKHDFSCLESILRRLFISVCFGLVSYYPLKKLYSSDMFKYIITNESKVIISSQIGVVGLLMIGKLFNCLVSFYVDDILSIS